MWALVRGAILLARLWNVNGRLALDIASVMLTVPRAPATGVEGARAAAKPPSGNGRSVSERAAVGEALLRVREA
eukprot:10590372-Alexandrium_andersonii.AAC.1